MVSFIPAFRLKFCATPSYTTRNIYQNFLHYGVFVAGISSLNTLEISILTMRNQRCEHKTSAARDCVLQLPASKSRRRNRLLRHRFSWHSSTAQCNRSNNNLKSRPTPSSFPEHPQFSIKHYFIHAM